MRSTQNKKTGVRSALKKTLGVVLIVLGLTLHLIPFFPAGWIIVIGLGLAGIPLLLPEKFLQKIRSSICYKRIKEFTAMKWMKIMLIILIAILVVAIGGYAIYSATHSVKNTSPTTTSTMTEKDARAIAEKACIKGGEALAPGYYNENSKTWWFDANLNAKIQGCNPACVVTEATKQAEINWRCTGAVPPK